jgi:anaerobic selenocysteine-containing dehydrogenase
VFDGDRQQLPRVWAHPHILAAAGLASGDEAVVESPYGSIRVRLEADPRQRQDTLFTNQGTWLGPGGTPNQLTGTVISHHGQLGAYNQVSVRLTRPPQAL